MRVKAVLWLIILCCILPLGGIACNQQTEATIEYRGQCETRLAGSWVFETSDRNLKWQVQNAGALTARFNMAAKEVIFSLGESKQEKESFKVIQCTEDVIFLEKTTKSKPAKPIDPNSAADQGKPGSPKRNVMTVVFKDKDEIELHVNENTLTFMRQLKDREKPTPQGKKAK